MGDTGPCQQPLEILLHQSTQVAHGQGDNGDDSQWIARFRGQHRGKAQQECKGCGFCSRGHQGGHRRGGTLVHVRHPKVEGNDSRLEQQAAHNQGQTHSPEGRPQSHARMGQTLDVEGPGGGVNQAGPHQEEGHTKGSQDEVTQACFDGFVPGAPEGRQAIQGDAKQLEPDEEDNHVLGAGHQNHADGGGDQQSVVLSNEGLFLIVITPGLSPSQKSRQHKN